MKDELDGRADTAAPKSLTHGRRFDLDARRNPSFGSSEHRSLGDFVHLNLPQSLNEAAPDSWKNDRKLRVGRCELTYGEIVALAGDLYGIASRPISDGATETDRKARFLAAFKTLEDAPEKEVYALVALMAEEAAAISKDVIEKGVPANVAAKDNDFDDKYTKATGGWYSYDLARSRYLQLAATNYDHFGFDAVAAYTAGHAVAIDMALEAARDDKSSAPKTQVFAKYERALALNAFADHFLTDLFSAGHLRVPRREAVEQIKLVLGGTASKAQHDEDNHWGLFVKSKRGHCWKCYGDNHLNTQQGADNREKVREAIVSSVREIYNSFNSGSPNAYEPLELIPDIDQVQHSGTDAGDRLNFPALLIPAAGKPAIAVRDPRHDVNAYNWKPAALLVMKKSPAIGPPNDYLPAPHDKPVLKGWDRIENPPRTASPVALKRVRYALANVGFKPYPDGLAAYHSSEQGPWSDWIQTRVGEYPRLLVAKDEDVRTIRRVLIRQIEGDLPELNFMILTQNREQEVKDINA